MKLANHIPKPHSSPFKGSLGAVSHVWIACSLLASALSLGGCLSDAEQARLEVDLVPLKASYKPGDTIWVEGRVLTDDQLDISLMVGHSSPAGLQYLTNGTEETFKDTVDLRRDFGRGYYVTPEACSGDLEFTVHLRAGIENTKHMKNFPLRTRIEGKDCGVAG